MKKFKLFAVCFLTAAIFLRAGAVTVSGYAEQSDSAAETGSEESDEENAHQDEEDSEYTLRSEKEVIRSMKLAHENETSALYYSEEEDLMALEYKKSGYIWWSSPINAQADENAKVLVKKQLQSSLVITVGEVKSRTTNTLRSAKNAKLIYKETDNGVRITYKFPSAGITVPVDYILEDDCLTAEILTSEIKEEKASDADSPVLLVDVSVLPNILSEDSDTKGYYVVPDGMGAVINFNNGKVNAKEYSGRVYGENITSPALTSNTVVQQVFMPVYGAVIDKKDAMLAVISEGDSDAVIRSSVSGLSKSSYNTCSASFILRTTDTYYISSKPLTVFEKGDLKSRRLKMTFYPMSSSNTDYCDIAARYRQYLMDCMGVQKKSEQTSLYIDVHAAAMKKESVLGIPVNRKFACAPFSETRKYVEELNGLGIKNITAVYRDWTDDGIENKVDVKTKASSVLGGQSEYEKMAQYFSQEGVRLYPAVNNKTFKTGNGFWTFTDTAVRASGQYSRQLGYNLAYGTQDSMKKPESLLSPSDFKKIFEKLSRNYSSGMHDGICIGEMTSVLYGDYAKESFSRDDSMQLICSGLENLRQSAGSVLADTANAYVLPYADHIINMPMASSRYDIFDDEIPFLQIVLHGVIPYTSVSVNSSADSEELFLTSAACGSQLLYDVLFCDSTDLKDTGYDRYFYAGSSGWTETMAGEYRFLNDLYEITGNDYITGYKRKDSVITTQYSSGIAVVTDIEKKEISVGSRILRLSDYIDTEGDVAD
ncbi:MAG: DUF5696 domain-containing protein [Oscillospiraceae bacterium]|nr:DUF5696 domain-containing protein [Oscillospiraceae bacterium]